MQIIEIAALENGAHRNQTGTFLQKKFFKILLTSKSIYDIIHNVKRTKTKKQKN